MNVSEIMPNKATEIPDIPEKYWVCSCDTPSKRFCVFKNSSRNNCPRNGRFVKAQLKNRMKQVGVA